MRRLLGVLKKILPWAVAALIFLYLFKQYPPEQLWQAVKHANLLYFIIIAIVYFIILYVVDCYAISYALFRFGYPVPLKELWPARAVTYLIMILNYPASQAAFAYYLKRIRNVPIFEVLSIFFFIAVVDLMIVLTLAFAGSLFQQSIIRGVDLSRYVQTVVMIAYSVFIFQFLFWRGYFSKWTGFKKEIKYIEWIKSKKIFFVFRDAALLDYLKMALRRSPLHATIVVFMYLTIHVFQASVPFVNVLGTIPIAYLIGTIPITPGGIGTTNVAIVELLSPHLSGPLVSQGVVGRSEIIFAITVLWIFVNYGLKALVGSLWLMKVSKKLFQPTGEENPKTVVSQATHLMGDI